MKFLVLGLCSALSASTISAAEKPNIVLIMADDMGFSDLGCYGSEIPTPHIDALAAGGLRFTQFYNSARCSPTRAALLTGIHPHQAGMGRLAEEAIGLTTVNPPAYLGYLNQSSVTLAEVLRPAGYKTYLAGKWHLGQRDEAKWPLQRGFDRFYGILAGACSYLKPDKPRGLTLDNQQLPAPTDPNYYTTDAFTDFAIQAIKEQKEAAPFFLYLAFTAPHWPLQARNEDIAKFVGKYRNGWDQLRAERHAKMISLGIVPKDSQLSERDSQVRTWETLSEDEKTRLDYRMAVYAAQIHRMDWNVGRLVATLKERGELENTLIFFLSDNGACAEPYTDLGGHKQDQINNPKNFGAVSYGTGWANASNTPFRKFKSTLHEGGISTPLIIHWPNGLKAKPGSLDSTPGCLTDIMPTMLQASGATYPKTFQGQGITPLEGTSLAPSIAGSPQPDPQRTFCWEQYDYKAVRQGDFKAVFNAKNAYDKTGSGQWLLYNIAQDRSETHDLAAQHPDQLKALIAQWQAWATRAHLAP